MPSVASSRVWSSQQREEEGKWQGVEDKQKEEREDSKMIGDERFCSVLSAYCSRSKPAGSAKNGSSKQK